jgi:hypothetical protein
MQQAVRHSDGACGVRGAGVMRRWDKELFVPALIDLVSD